MMENNPDTEHGGTIENNMGICCEICNKHFT